MGGMGTGLAPLYGIARDALFQGHQGNIVMVIGAKERKNLYYQHQLSELAQQHPNFHVEYSVQIQSNDSDAILPDSNIYQTISELLPDMTGCEAYLCGNQSFVKKLRKDCFLRGANLADIKCDEFLRAAA